MKILLVTPFPNRSITFSKTIFSSLTLKQLVAITPLQHHVEIIDERYQKINFNNNYDVVGISCMTYNSLRAYKIADEFRRRGAIVVLGGYHPTALPYEAKQHADSVVIGEAELTWPKLLSDLKSGKLKPFYKTNKLVEGSLIPAARHDIGYTNKYVDSIQVARGCPVGCEFCSIRNIEGIGYRPRKIDSIIDEIKTIESRRIFFSDSSLTTNPSYSKALFKEMIGINKKFTVFGNVNILGKDDELLKLSSEAGCGRWLIGIESFNQKNLDNIGKKTNKVQQYAKTIRKIKSYGIGVNGMFIFGFDNDTIDVFKNTVKAIQEIDLDVAFFNILTPYPGTPVFERLDRVGRILTKDWSKYLSRCANRSVVFQPKNMTPKQLVDGSVGAANSFYSLRNVSKKWLRDKDLSYFGLLRRMRGYVSINLFYNGYINY